MDEKLRIEYENKITSGQFFAISKMSIIVHWFGAIAGLMLVCGAIILIGKEFFLNSKTSVAGKIFSFFILLLFIGLGAIAVNMLTTTSRGKIDRTMLFYKPIFGSWKSILLKDITKIKVFSATRSEGIGIWQVISVTANNSGSDKEINVWIPMPGILGLNSETKEVLEYAVGKSLGSAEEENS
jgi:hypothetical protein